MLKVGDQVKVVSLLTQKSTATAVYSQPFELGKYTDFAVLINCGSTAYTTNIGVNGYIVCGKATEGVSSYTQLTNSSFIASPVGTTMNNIWEGRISMRGTVTTASTGMNVIIDGLTFTAATAANSTARAFSCTNTSYAAISLSSLIAANVTYLETTYTATAATHADVWVRPKPDAGGAMKTFSMTATVSGATASADAIGGVITHKSYLLEFKAEDVVSQNSSWTHAALYLNSTDSTAGVYNAVLMASGARFTPNQTIARGQVSTVSSAFTS